MSFNTIKYHVCLKPLSRIMAHVLVTRFTLTIKTSLNTCLPRVNLRQITLLRGYIHPNEQAVVFIP